jgi:hypothetical protein
MTRDPFDAPPLPGGGIKWDALNGALLLVRPTAVEEKVKTSLGEKDAVVADVTVIDGDDAGEEFADALIFPLVLQGQLRRSIGRQILGRLGKGLARPGQSAPWVLAAPTADDRKAGMRWLANDIAAPASAGEPPF